MIPLGLPHRALAALQEAGVTALCLNVLVGGGVGLADVEAYEQLAREMGWHLQVLLDARDLPVPVVIDHMGDPMGDSMGHVPTSAGRADLGFRTLVDLVRDGAWLKFQGASRTSTAGPPYADTVPFARALNEAAPDRSLLGLEPAARGDLGPDARHRRPARPGGGLGSGPGAAAEVLRRRSAPALRLPARASLRLRAGEAD
ncbi:hypothetical protein ASG63_19335 [Methylobacterium sp. Leaf94]|uniref:amidohydrolase family protein n=1 Tax=Methylobacterium sp. Leaf94 TaxID=1736250 RepID=UPI0006F80BF5|nr:hypothetical protein ASG63_19335 [Methylobacterium sp. Leaf94]